MNLIIIIGVIAACAMLAVLLFKAGRWQHVLAGILVSNNAGFAFFDANGRCVKISGVVSDILPECCKDVSKDVSEVQFAMALYGARACDAFGSYFIECMPVSNMRQHGAFVLLDDGSHYLAQIFVLSTGAQFFILSDASRYIAPIEAYKMLEERKAASLKCLASHVVHDLNNVVLMVDGYARISNDAVGSKVQPMKALEATQKAMERCRILTQDLTDFINGEAIQFSRISKRDVSLAGMIDDALHDFRRELAADVTFYADVADMPDTIGVPLRADMFSTLLYSLLDNAREAIDRDGVIHVAARLQNYGGQRYLCIDVEDNGGGIAPQNFDAVFDLYHTTKQDKGHSGFGLARAKSIADAHDGHIYVTSELGQGAHFTCILPVAEHRAQVQDLPHEEDNGVRSLKGVTVLVVDDEDGILMTVESILQDVGATVLLANGSNEALMKVDDHADSIDVVLSDIVMPEMNGVKFSALVNSMLPEVPVLFMTGYAGLSVSDRIEVPEGAIVVKKPFEPEQMTDAIMRAIGANHTERAQVRQAV